MIVIGVVGKQNSGKDTLVRYLQETRGFHKLSTGGIIRDLADREGVARTRDKLQDVAAELISRRGEDYLADVLLRRMDEHASDRVAITGLRTPADVQALRRRMGDAFTLVRVSTQNPKARFQRAETRGETRDADTYEEFLEHDTSENELFDLNKTLDMADITVPNDGTIEEFHSAIERQIAGVLLEED